MPRLSQVERVRNKLAKRSGLTGAIRHWQHQDDVASGKVPARKRRAVPQIPKSYAAYIASPAWDGKRREALRYHGNRCNRCGASRCVLQVHHISYARLGREKMTDLEVLCVGCHGIEHEGKYGPSGVLGAEYSAICGNR